MDFIDWCSHVLKKLIEVRSSPEALNHGAVFDTWLAQSLFGEEQTTRADYVQSTRRSAVMEALAVLQRVNLITKKKTGQVFKIEVTPLGREKVSDMPSLWQPIILATPQPESEQLLELVNQRTQKIEHDHVWLDDLSHELLPELGWGDKGKLMQAIRDLEQFRLVHTHPALGSDLNLRATYEGLVWETRRFKDAGCEPELAYVLFLDIVGYSKLAMEQQTKVLRQLMECVQDTDAFRRARDGGQLIRLPTGDGIALVFFRGLTTHVQCAVELSRSLKNHPELKLRIGAHTGPVTKIKDINRNPNVSGPGINFAQRVMDCGDAGHILISKTVAEHLNELGNWNEYLHDLGEAEVKHGARVHLFNLYGSDFGNPNLPVKLISAPAQDQTMVAMATAQHAPSQVSLEPILEKDLTFNSDERQEYRLKISIKNRGADQVDTYRLEVEFPAIFLNENWHPSWEEIEKRTEGHRFFRITQEVYAGNPLKQTIYSGDTRHLLTIPYHVDEKNDRDEALEDRIWVTVYSRDEPVRSVQNPMSDFVQ
jgi:class 3 adenylate cyclase